MLASGTKLSYVRRPSRDFVKERRGDFNAAFVSNRRKVKNCIRRAANAHINRYCVLEGFTGQNVSRANIFLDKVHEDCSGAFGKDKPIAGVSRRNRPVAGQSHAESLA